MVWLFFCSDQPSCWQGGVRNTCHTSSQTSSMFWWMLRAELCTSKTATVRPHLNVLQGGKIQYPLVFPLYQETPCMQMPLISANVGCESWNGVWLSRSTFPWQEFEQKSCNFPQSKVINSSTFQTRAKP